MIFKDREDAGLKLAKVLQQYAHRPNTIIIALPRGGVVVGFEVARALDLPLDIICPRKIGAPFNPELAIGAVTETGEGIYNQELIQELGISQVYLQKEVEKEKKAAQWRLEHYRKGLSPRNLKDKNVIIIDDGLATGSTMLAAIQSVRMEKAKEIIVAVPVAPPQTLNRLRKEVSQAVCLVVPTAFYSVGEFYDFFNQITDDEVINLLQRLSFLPPRE